MVQLSNIQHGRDRPVRVSTGGMIARGALLGAIGGMAVALVLLIAGVI